MAEYSLIPKSSITQVLKLNEVCRNVQTEMALAEQAGDEMVRAIIAGTGMNQLRALMTDEIMADIMQLVGSPLGISCETNAQWPMPVVRDVVLSGLLCGARPIGGEMHIASGRLYLTKVYWERRFKEFPGVTNVMPPDLGLPTYRNLGDKSYATVPARLQYRLNNTIQTLDRTGDSAITVVVNKGMGLDAIHGKVKKRLYQTAYAVVSGIQVLDDHDPDEVQGTVLVSVVTPVEPQPLENPGDDIAADAAEALRNHTPAPELRDQPVPAHDKEWALDQMRRKPRKAVAAWVEHCSRQGLDITNEADEYLRSA